MSEVSHADLGSSELKIDAVVDSQQLCGIIVSVSTLTITFNNHILKLHDGNGSKYKVLF